MATTKAIALTSERQVVNALRKADRLKAEIKAMQDEVEAIRARVLAFMGERAEVETNAFRVYNTPYTRRSIDSAKLKAAGLYDQYCTTTPAHRFGYTLK